MKHPSENQSQEVLAGLVERVTYHNVENGFCVLRAKARGHRDVVTVVGHAATIAAGEWITASGEWVNDRHTVSKCGDTLARLCLYEAATVIMTRIKRPLDLKVWAMKIARRSGANKARVALARKLAVILHSIWRTGEPFRWGPHETVA
jgi:hypothetical protein